MAMLAGFCAGCGSQTEVVISVEADQIGMPLSSIPVSVTVNGKAVECRAEWSMLKDTMDGYSIPTDTLEEGNDYLVFIYYNAGTTADDENLNITVEGAQYDYSDTFGDEVMTAAHVNLMEEGNMVIVCSGVAPSAPLNPYMVILKDGERVPFNYHWTGTDEEGTAPADAYTIVEYGKAYTLYLEIFPREEFKLEDYSVSANCGDGVLSSVSQEGNVVYATLTYVFSMRFVYASARLEDSLDSKVGMYPSKDKSARKSSAFSAAKSERIEISAETAMKRWSSIGSPFAWRVT